MERNLETTPLSMQNAPERGAGGKLRRQSARRPPTTPYARPLQNQAQRSRWLSRLVDPACRFLAGGATRILPSLFSKSSAINALPAPNNEERDHDELHTELKQHASCGEHNWTLNHAESRSTEVEGPSRTEDRSRSNTDSGAYMQGKMGLTDDGGLSEIEKLMEGKIFSRDETDRLIEIINSRAVDPHDVEEEKKYLGVTRNEEAERPIVAPEDPRKSLEGKEEDMNKALWASSTPLPQSVMPVEVGASPVEIARAYMGSRTSEISIASKSLILKDERALIHDDEFPSKPYIPSPSPKPSTCWPGAMLQDQRGYVTPQSQRGRFGLHHFPRTPYSRTIYSKSKSKSKLTQLQDDGTKRLNISSAPFQQLQTPSFGQFKSRSKALDDEHGSVGPVRRIRHKAVVETPSRGSAYFHSLKGPSRLENPNVSEGFFPAIKKNLEGGTSSFSLFQSVDGKSKSSEVGIPTVHPHSSKMARTILEHLERNPPTPKDKSAELKLVTSWRKQQSSDDTSVMPNEQNGFPHSRGVDFPRNSYQADKKNLAQLNEDRGNSLSEVPHSLFKVPSPSSMNESNDVLNRSTSASNVKFDGAVMTQSDNAGPSLESRKTQDPQIKNTHEDAVKFVSSAAGSEVLNLRKPPSNFSGSKPVLPSISVSKPEQRWTFPSDSSIGFTFPVSSSSGASFEPPTPSIMPSLSASVVCQPNEEHAVPSYSFGSNRSTPALVFSFPSTSSAPKDDDASDIKFNFGSNKTTRISFSSIGKDAICY